MKTVGWILILLIFLTLNSLVYAQQTDDTATTEETEESATELVITTKEQLKAAIEAVGLENAIKQALSQGVLNGQDITSAALETGNSPTVVISTLIVAGVPQNDVVVAANDFGVDPGVIGEAVREGVQERQRQAASQGQGSQGTEGTEETEDPDDTGTITVDTTLTDPVVEEEPPPPPPDIISGFPGGTDPAEPVSKVIP